MKRRKIIGFIIILIGIMTVSYPVRLRILANIEQKRLKEEFVQNKQTSNQVVKGNGKEEIKIIKYYKWPETLMKIPKIDVEAIVVEMKASNIDVFAQNENYPPAHYRTTDYPGGNSNVGIAAHRTGPADYFRHLDKLEEGDIIILETTKGKHEYIVERVFIVDPTENSVIRATDYGALTLTSCEREDGVSNKKRIIVRARLKD